MSEIYAAQGDFIIDETYYQEDNCRFVGSMWITGSMSTTVYDNSGNAVRTWGR